MNSGASYKDDVESSTRELASTSINLLQIYWVLARNRESTIDLHYWANIIIIVIIIIIEHRWPPLLSKHLLLNKMQMWWYWWTGRPKDISLFMETICIHNKFKWTLLFSEVNTHWNTTKTFSFYWMFYFSSLSKFVEPIVWSSLKMFYQIQLWSLLIAKFQPNFQSRSKGKIGATSERQQFLNIVSDSNFYTHSAQ